MADNQLTQEVEQALAGLVKLLKALRFYPKGHPSLRTAIDECMSVFRPLLTRRDNRAIQVSQNGFSLGEAQIGEGSPALPDLARLLAERRVNRLIFLPDLTPHELLILLEGLSTTAEEVYQMGGLPVFLQERRVTGIWLNESSLDQALLKRRQLVEELEAEEIGEENPPGDLPLPQEKSDLARELRELIEQLDLEQHDDAYRTLIDRLLELAPAYFEQSGLPGTLRILPLLLMQSRQDERSRVQRSCATGALDRLLSPTLVDQLLIQFKRTSLTPQQFQRLQKFIVALGVRIAPQLLDMMSSEEDSSARKRLTTLLGKMGEPLLDLLRETIHSSKWFVVRNAVTLLGDLRLESGLALLEALTDHPDQRVRRAVIRSLSMIGGDKAVKQLLKLAEDPAIPLRRPAVKALGATRSGAAVAPLLAIAQRFDPFGHHTDLRRDAVSALGTLGDKKAVVTLLALAKRPNLLRLQRVEELRAEIIAALGKLGDNNLAGDLEKWRKSPHGAVQRAAEQSLSLLTRKNADTATN